LRSRRHTRPQPLFAFYGQPPTRLHASGVSYLSQHAITQERGAVLALARKEDDLLREELSFVFGFAG
jgi:hypothetical protein